MTDAQLYDGGCYLFACACAYSEPDKPGVAQEIDPKNFDRFSARITFTWHDTNNETQLCILERSHPDETIVSFRGLLDSFDLADFIPFREPSVVSRNRKHMMNDTGLVDCSEMVGVPGAMCQEGIHSYSRLLEEGLREYFTPEWTASHKGHRVVVTGFSMGASLAGVLGLVLRRWFKERGEKVKVKIVGFASPRIGNRELLEALEKPGGYLVFYRRGDPVASFPCEEGYSVGGDWVVIDDNINRYAANDGSVPPFLTYSYPSDPGMTVHVTTEKMDAGLLSLKEGALPDLGVVGPMANYHKMVAVQDAFDSDGLPNAEESRMIEEARLVGASTPPQETGMFTCLCGPERPIPPTLPAVGLEVEGGGKSLPPSPAITSS